MSVPVLPLREALTGKVRPALLVLFGAVTLLLLIAIVNVASLMFVRGNAREREMAVRLSLGAARGRLVRQLLTESLLLACGGGAAGMAMAWWGVNALKAWNPGDLPRIEDVHLDLRAAAFTLAIAVLSGIIFGLAPALRCSRPNLNAAMKSGGKGSNAGLGRRSAQRVLAAAEVALSCALLIGGGLELHSLLQLDHVNAGFQAAPEQVLSLRVSPSRGKSAPAGSPIISRFARLLERASSLPGIASAALTDAMPPGRSDFDTFQIDGQPWSEAAFPAVTEVIVSPEYFRTLQIPLLKGRYFTSADLGDTPRGIIISESLARRYFSNGDPIGRQMAPSSPNNHNAFRPIVGVVADVKYTGLDSTAEPAFYRLFTEFNDFYSLQLVVRSTVAPTLARQLERVVHEVDPSATMSERGTLAAIRSESEAQPRFRTLLIASFAGAALLLSAIGVYGVIAFSVAQRTNEIGIRMALGAGRGSVLRQVLGSGAMLGITGTVTGSAGALLFTRVLRGLLFGTSATEPVVFASVAFVLVTVAVVASLIPAIRAIRIDPKEALRYE
jgi:putative ABC transport system permease protein